MACLLVRGGLQMGIQFGIDQGFPYGYLKCHWNLLELISHVNEFVEIGSGDYLMWYLGCAFSVAARLRYLLHSFSR